LFSKDQYDTDHRFHKAVVEDGGKKAPKRNLNDKPSNNDTISVEPQNTVQNQPNPIQNSEVTVTDVEDDEEEPTNAILEGQIDDVVEEEEELEGDNNVNWLEINWDEPDYVRTRSQEGLDYIDFTKYKREGQPGANLSPAQRANLKTPLDFFMLFITIQVINEFVYGTNLYGKEKYKNNWIDTIFSEFKKLIALILFFGIVKYPSRETAWSKGIFGHELPKKTMKLNRYNQLLKVWHHVEVGKPMYT